MKKRILTTCLMFIIIILSIVPAYAATGAYNLGNSSPANIVVYYPNTWSGQGDWTPPSSIPTNATVTNMQLSWTTFGQTYTGMHIALFDATGSGYYAPYNNAYISGHNGKPVHQKWSSQFWVDNLQWKGNPLYVTPQLTIYYQY